MSFSRRHFLGASIMATASLAAPSVLAAPDRMPSGPLPAQPRFSDGPPILNEALAALDRHDGRITHRDVIGIADYSLHSKEMRFHLVDVAGGRIRDSYLVSHGRGSDPANSGFVQRFSNRPGSNASSRGSFVTGDEYVGKHGRSRRLHGLDDENNLAFDRAIVIHGASYVDREMARRQGRVGRSLGCFAFETSEIGKVLEQLGPGRLLYSAN